ncbi:hypothetical protein X737_37710 [Mesorhizobium sp. L48C026A00]|nr:hypothetical protein X737_37710 [Mesorhizobium sp. L48C026A00]
MAGAQIVDQALETGTLHGPACGSSQILVDHLYFAESPAPRDVDKLILPTLALKVELDLRLSGLTHIDDGLALEDGSRIRLPLVIAALLLRCHAGGGPQYVGEPGDHYGPLR